MRVKEIARFHLHKVAGLDGLAKPGEAGPNPPVPGSVTRKMTNSMTCALVIQPLLPVIFT